MFDFFKSVQTVAEDRIKSPVFGTAILLFAIHEWRVIAVLLMSYKYADPSDLIIAVRASYEPISWGWFSIQYLVILLAAPILGLGVDLAKTVIDVFYTNTNHTIRKHVVLSRGEANQIRHEIIEREAKSKDLLFSVEKERDESRRENAQLKIDIQREQSLLNDSKLLVLDSGNEHKAYVEKSKNEIESLKQENVTLKQKDLQAKRIIVTFIDFFLAIKSPVDFTGDESAIYKFANFIDVSFYLCGFNNGDSARAKDMRNKYKRIIDKIGGRRAYDISSLTTNGERIIASFGASSNMAKALEDAYLNSVFHVMPTEFSSNIELVDFARSNGLVFEYKEHEIKREVMYLLTPLGSWIGAKLTGMNMMEDIEESPFRAHSTQTTKI